MDWTQIIIPLVAAFGGCVSGMFLLPEKKQAARLDNAERVIEKYEHIIEGLEKQNEKLTKRVEELENNSRSELMKRDLRIKELENELSTVKEKLHSLEQKRGRDGRFVKNVVE